MLKAIKQPYAVLILINAIIWAIAFFIFFRRPVPLSLCLLAYGLGLRHGIDADHVAAIDSVTRKLIGTHASPKFIGLFFSLGHSTIVIILSVFVAITATSIHQYFPSFSLYGGMIGSFFSVFFLLMFSIVNFVICFDLIKKIKGYARNQIPNANTQIKTGGFLSRLLKPIFKIVDKSWHMYFVGFLFGLGFDTATEIALLGISAYTVTQHISIWAIMIFPGLFTAGMCLVDTTSGLLILHACRWAYVNYTRKLYYNLIVTSFSFLTAFIIASYEITTIVSDKLRLALWQHVKMIGDNFELIGFCIVTFFGLVWLFFILLHRHSKSEFKS